MTLTLPKMFDLSVADAIPERIASVWNIWFISNLTLYCGLCTLTMRLSFLLVQMSPIRHRHRKSCPILEVLHLRKAIVPLGVTRVALHLIPNVRSAYLCLLYIRWFTVWVFLSSDSGIWILYIDVRCGVRFNILLLVCEVTIYNFGTL